MPGFQLPPSIYVGTSKLREFCEWIKGFYHEIYIRYPWLTDDSITISYEDLASNAQEIFDNVIFPFLGLPSSQISSTFKKQNIKELSEMIENYYDVKPLIEQTFVKQNYPFFERAWNSTEETLTQRR